ncbi:MAG TPA: 3-phosphoshikimate 1-carboxyvinyltransferase [Thermoplasmata archaeon]|nr:3-phosphoshikimate 1-carboxyvinyltransferase [Thermoplasmata archaeon]
MSRLQIGPGPLRGAIVAPPSKSYTHRELVASFLAAGRSQLIRPLVSDDTTVTRRGLERLGARVIAGRRSWLIEPPRADRRISHRGYTIDCGQSGTSLRLLAALAATCTVPITLTGRPQLARRPIGPLLDVLERAGASIRRAPRGLSTPTTVTGPIHSVSGAVETSQSSQFLSALLLVLPSIEGTSQLHRTGIGVSEPYVAATLDVLHRRGVIWESSGRTMRLRGPVKYRASRARIPGDASSAAYLWAGAAISGGSVLVRGVPLNRPQGDLSILGILERMGAHLRTAAGGVRVDGAPLHGISVELTNAPDLVPLVGVLGAFSKGSTWIRGATHAGLKESDRRARTADLVRALGGTARSTLRRIRVRPGRRPLPLRWTESEDHRLVMSAAIGALGAGSESTVGDARLVAKSYPDFWRSLGQLGADLRRTL